MLMLHCLPGYRYCCSVASSYLYTLLLSFLLSFCAFWYATARHWPLIMMNSPHCFCHLNVFWGDLHAHFRWLSLLTGQQMGPIKSRSILRNDLLDNSDFASFQKGCSEAKNSDGKNPYRSIEQPIFGKWGGTKAWCPTHPFVIEFYNYFRFQFQQH